MTRSPLANLVTTNSRRLKCAKAAIRALVATGGITDTKRTDVA
jgi:hypothetical protein